MVMRRQEKICVSISLFGVDVEVIYTGFKVLVLMNTHIALF